MSASSQAPPSGSGPLRGRWLLVAASLVVVVAGLRAAAPVALPLLFAVFLALLAAPIVDWLRGLGIRPWLAALLTVLLVFAALALFGFAMSGAFGEFADNAPRYLELLVERVREVLDGLRERGIRVSAWLAADRLDTASVVDFASNVVGGTVRGLASFVSFATLVVVLMICMLFEGAGLPDKLRQALSSGSESPGYLLNVTREMQRYLATKTLVSLATGLILGLWVWALDVPFPVMLGLTAFLLNYIPAIGSIVASVPAILLALLQLGPGRAALVAGGYLLVNFAIGNVVEPLLMGRRFGLSTLAVFVTLLFWGWVWGPLGMLLAVPLTMIIKIALQQHRDLGWIAALMGPLPRSVKPPVPVDPAD